jgi:hypothetical protein
MIVNPGPQKKIFQTTNPRADH